MYQRMVHSFTTFLSNTEATYLCGHHGAFEEGRLKYVCGPVGASQSAPDPDRPTRPCHRNGFVVQPAPITLEGRHVRLEPLAPHHADALLDAALDPRIWEFTSSVLRNADDVRKYVDVAL